MGTNYYLFEKPPCKCCQRPYEALHIGKSSAGWCFSLHVIPERELMDADSWLAACAADDAYIEDEYKQRISLSEMIDTICNRKWEKGGDSRVPYGYSSWTSFHAENHSQLGPNGLVRHRLDGVHCIAHGDKTWDAITGEFC